MSVDLVVPSKGTVEVADLTAMLGSPAGIARPFSEDRVALAAALSQRVRADRALKRDPASVAFSYWLRPSAVRAMSSRFTAEQAPGVLRAPSGVVFQLAPANVATMFAYAWALSFLLGNVTVTKLSGRLPEQGWALAGAIEELLREADFSHLQASTFMVRYEHDHDTTAAISARCDRRMVWGGDGTVSAVRLAPLPPRATEVTFADRFSFMLVDATAYLALGAEQQRKAARAAFNDIYWFDQNACSSPRAVVWRGNAAEAAAASRIFYPCLEQEIRSAAHVTSAGAYMTKLADVYSHLADTTGAKLWRSSNELLVVDLPVGAALPRDCLGLGTIYNTRVERLEDLPDMVERRDQTVSHLGFTIDELMGVAQLLQSRGVDRLVPVGQALSFGRYWDGYDLFQSLTRTVEVRTS